MRVPNRVYARRHLRVDSRHFYAWKNNKAVPDGVILYYNADYSARRELTRYGHKLEALILGDQHEIQPDGSVVNIGANPPVDTINGEKWLRSCGAVTNLFSGDTSVARSVTLTAQKYTLHVFGAGSASCSYGTATVGSPLTFTAIVGSVTFTPTGATLWMLTATAYPVPYTPPGTTMPASNATITNGSWFKLLDGSELWKALDGQPDGVELLASKDFTGFAINSEPSSFVSGGKLNLVNITSTHTVAYKAALLVVGQRYTILSVKIDSISGGVAFKGSGGTPSAYITTPGIHRVVFGSNFTGPNFEIVATVGTNAVLSSLSIQRIAPQPLTLATRVRMGVGSGDLVTETTIRNICSANDYTVAPLMAFRGDPAVARIVQVKNGSLWSGHSSLWERAEVVRRVVQVDANGAQFRSGYMIEGVQTSITWNGWVAFNGSFGPSTLYRLMLGFNNPYPMWYNKIAAWRKQATDAEIMEALA